MCVALVSLLTAGRARGDELSDAKTMERAGIVETGIGVGLDLVGAGMLFGAVFTPSCAFALGAPEEGRCGHGGTIGTESTVSALFWTGIAASVVGDVMWVAGAVQWSVGAHRVRRLQRSSAPR